MYGINVWYLYDRLPPADTINYVLAGSAFKSNCPKRFVMFRQRETKEPVQV